VDEEKNGISVLGTWRCGLFWCSIKLEGEGED